MARTNQPAVSALSALSAAMLCLPGSAFLIWPRPPHCADAAQITPCAANTFLDPLRLSHTTNGTSRAVDPARGAPGCCSACPPGFQTNIGGIGATGCAACSPGRYTPSSAQPCRDPAPTQVTAVHFHPPQHSMRCSVQCASETHPYAWLVAPGTCDWLVPPASFPPRRISRDSGQATARA